MVSEDDHALTADLVAFAPILSDAATPTRPAVLVDQTLTEFARHFALTPAAWRSVSWLRRMRPILAYERFPSPQFLTVHSVVDFQLALLDLCDDDELDRLSRASEAVRIAMTELALADLMKRVRNHATQPPHFPTPLIELSEPAAS